MLEEEATTEQPIPESATDATQSDPLMDTDTYSALLEVIAITGAQGEAASFDEEVQRQIEEAPIVRLANTILQSAIKERASEANIEPEQNCVAVRFRLDGVLHVVMRMPRYILAPLTRRYKVLADVNIIEYRVPQQGQIRCRYAGDEYNLRYSSLPTPYGEKTTIHVPNSSIAKLTLNNLGFIPKMQEGIENLLYLRRGMLLIASGNGQGKTTTQHVLLNRLNNIGVSIFEVAPDYEYAMPGITQARLNPRIGYTAETALVSIADLGAEVVALDRCHTNCSLAF